MLLKSRHNSNIISNRTTRGRHHTTHRPTSNRRRTTFRTRCITHNSLIRRTRPPPRQTSTFRRSTHTDLQHFQLRRLHQTLPRDPNTNSSHYSSRTSSRRHSTYQPMRPVMFRLCTKRHMRSLSRRRRRQQGTRRTSRRSRSTTS